MNTTNTCGSTGGVSGIERRLEKLERANRRWRMACAVLVACGAAGVMVAQAAGPRIEPTIICRGIKIVDPQGRKRGEFVMANNRVALRMFDQSGNVLAKLDPDDLEFMDDAGVPLTRLSFFDGLEVGASDGPQTKVHEGGMEVLDSAQRTRAMISLGRTPHFAPSLESETPSLMLFGEGQRGYEVFIHGDNFFH